MIVTVVNTALVEKAVLPMFVTLAGIVMLPKLVVEKAELPMVLKLLGSVTLSKSKQEENALLPICVTPSGIVTLVILFLPLNARTPIETTGRPPIRGGIFMTLPLPS
jgi:hypothetical protein